MPIPTNTLTRLFFIVLSLSLSQSASGNIHQDISGKSNIDLTIDTRLFTKEGRAQIAEDAKITKVGFYDVVKDIISKESITIGDTFSHQIDKVNFFNGMQDAIRNNKVLQAQLADPNLSKQQKDQLINKLAIRVASKLNIKLGNVTTIATGATTEDGKLIKGAFHRKSNDIVMNDVNIKSNREAIKVLGHEIAHRLDKQRGRVRRGTTVDGKSYAEEYADTLGVSLQDYVDFAMWNNTDGQTIARTNTHKGMVDSQGNTIATTDKASRNFELRRKNHELEYLTQQVKDDFTKRKAKNPELEKLYSSEQKVALSLYNISDIKKIKDALDNRYPPLNEKSKQRILTSLSKAKEYDQSHKLERAYENLVTDSVLVNTVKPIDDAFIGVQDAVQTVKEVADGEYTDAGILITEAVLKKVPGGKQVFEKIEQATKKTDFVDLASPQRRRHILDGDATGGGHRFGTRKPGKSEFPQSWSDDRIMHEISDVATDPSLVSRRGRGGRTITDGMRDGINIRVIQERNGDIVSGFPTNVPRNPR